MLPRVLLFAWAPGALAGNFLECSLAEHVAYCCRHDFSSKTARGIVLMNLPS